MGGSGASATPRKSVLAGACRTGVNTAEADVGDEPGTYCTTTVPPVPSAPVPVQMFNTYWPSVGSVNPVMARAFCADMAGTPFSADHANFSADVQPVGRLNVVPELVRRLSPVVYPVTHTVSAFWTAMSAEAVAVRSV